jgi:hypothetical protein
MNRECKSPNALRPPMVFATAPLFSPQMAGSSRITERNPVVMTPYLLRHARIAMVRVVVVKRLIRRNPQKKHSRQRCGTSLKRAFQMPAYQA